MTLVLGKVWSRLNALAAAQAETTLDDLAQRLRALEELARPEPTGPAEPQPERGWPARNHPGPPVVRLSAATVRIDAAEASAVSGPTLIAVPNLTAAAPTPAAPSVTLELGRRYGPIWDLADAGETPDAIARATGQPVGQVELILALRRQAAAGAAEPRPA
jgi:hypothetical protein